MNSTGNFNYNVNGFIQKDRESKEDKLCGYDHKLVLNLYNSSDSPKYLRDLKKLSVSLLAVPFPIAIASIL